MGLSSQTFADVRPPSFSFSSTGEIQEFVSLFPLPFITSRLSFP